MYNFKYYRYSIENEISILPNAYGYTGLFEYFKNVCECIKNFSIAIKGNKLDIKRIHSLPHMYIMKYTNKIDLSIQLYLWPHTYFLDQNHRILPLDLTDRDIIKLFNRNICDNALTEHSGI